MDLKCSTSWAQYERVENDKKRNKWYIHFLANCLRFLIHLNVNQTILEANFVFANKRFYCKLHHMSVMKKWWRVLACIIHISKPINIEIRLKWSLIRFVDVFNVNYPPKNPMRQHSMSTIILPTKTFE